MIFFVRVKSFKTLATTILRGGFVDTLVNFLANLGLGVYLALLLGFVLGLMCGLFGSWFLCIRHSRYLLEQLKAQNEIKKELDKENSAMRKELDSALTALKNIKHKSIIIKHEI